MILNREDPEQDNLIASRFEIYNSNLPISPLTAEILSFLTALPPATSAIDRRQVLTKSTQLQNKEQKVLPLEASVKQISSKVLAIDPPPSDLLSSQEKLILLRALPKHLGDWEKICREFKDRTIPADVLKKIWRCIKVTMKEEVADIRKKAPSYHYIKWLRAAVRKLELNSGKKIKIKNSVNINPRPKEQRIDILTIMADAENAKCSGIQSNTSLNVNSSSSFKAYEMVGTLQELCN